MPSKSVLLMTEKTAEILQRHNYRWQIRLETRWLDNDVYGHINNVVYYGLFDTAVNRYLIETGALDIHQGAVIGLVVESGCRYFAPMAFPDIVQAGVGVTRVGNTSVSYQVGLFRNDDVEPAAQGHFVHVYVDRQSRRPTSLPDRLRQAVSALVFI
jgi:acyl-CoA thioester hydrolase